MEVNKQLMYLKMWLWVAVQQ